MKARQLSHTDSEVSAIKVVFCIRVGSIYNLKLQRDLVVLIDDKYVYKKPKKKFILGLISEKKVA